MSTMLSSNYSTYSHAQPAADTTPLMTYRPQHTQYLNSPSVSYEYITAAKTQTSTASRFHSHRQSCESAFSVSTANSNTIADHLHRLRHRTSYLGLCIKRGIARLGRKSSSEGLIEIYNKQ